ncbi:MAG: hypothetical protein Q7T20_16640 [Saprospiraceae bacterium]|nr:hypothetical protein [Saprospiraceae bacterium]
MTKRREFLPSAPNKGIWITAIILGVLAILARFVPIGELSQYHYWMLLIAFLLLAIGTAYRKV